MLKRFLSFSISTKFYILLAIIFLPSLCVVTYTYMENRADLIREAEAEALLLVQSIAHHQANEVEGFRKLLMAVADIPEVRQKDVAACNRLFRDLVRSDTRSLNIGIASLDGRVIASAVPMPSTDVYINDRRHFRNVVSKREFSVGEYYAGRITNKAALHFAYPVTDKRGRLHAVVYASINTENFNRMFGDMNFPEGTVVNITDRQGVIIYRNLETNKTTGSQDLPHLRDHMTSDTDEGSFFDAGRDGVKRLYGFKRLRLSKDQDPYLYVRVGIPASMALKNANRVFNRNLLLLGAVVLISFIVSRYASDFLFVRKIRSIVDVARQYAVGKFDSRTAVSYEGEIGAVAKSFDELGAALEEQQRKRAEAEALLRESEEKYRTILQTIEDGYVETDASDNITLVNPAAGRMLGYSADELKGMNYRKLMDKTAARRVKHVFDKTYQPEETSDFFDYEITRQDGTRVYIDAAISLLRDEKGTPTGFRRIARDITERKRSEIALKNQIEFVMTLLDTIPSPVFYKDVSGRYLGCNHAFEELLGIPREGIIGKSVHELSPAKIAEKYQAMDDELLDHGGRQTYEWKVRAADGSQKDVIFNKTTFPDAGGSIAGIVGVMVDITGRKRAEEEVRAYAREISDLYNNAPCGYYSVDRNGMFVRINDTQLNWLGYTREEVVGKINIADIHTSESLKTFRETFPVFKERGWMRDLEFEFVRKDGTVLPVLLNATVISDEDGNYLMSRSSVFDITKRREAEESLRESEEKYRTILETMEDCYLETDIAGRVTFFNPAASRMLGYPADELLGMTYKKLVDNEAAGRVRQIFENIFRTGKAMNLADYELTRRDGSNICIESSISLITDANGAPTGFRGLARDISERKRAERALIRSNADLEEINRMLELAMNRTNELAVKAEIASKAKSEFLATMSHEIRTPMNGVMGMLSLLLDSRLSSEQREQTELAYHSAKALLGIINDILDFSKIEAGKLDLETVDFSMRETIKDAANMFVFKAREKGLKLAYHTRHGVPPVLRGDQGRLRQVVINLLGNAVKFTKEGEVSITTTLEKETENSVVVRLAVTDTGIGIPSGKVEQLFMPFSQIDASYSRKFGGTGLGLAISKRLVEMMGGKIGVEGEEGKGSTFWVELPFEKGAVAEGTTGEGREVFLSPGDVCAAGRRAKINILLAEDSAVNQKVALHILEKYGYRNVDLAVNGKEALAALETKAYDVILMDVQMPEMDGLEATRKIREKEGQTGGGRVSIIAMTAHALNADRERCLESGMDDFISKPIEPKELMGVIEKHSSAVG